MRVLFALIALCHAVALIVNTTSGPVRGDVLGSTKRWLGIPYAVPPLGNLRWTAPIPPTPSTAVIDARNYGPSCIQEVSVSYVFGPNNTFSEDCLFLNVFAPENATETSALPVMVFIHGGAFVGGGSAQVIYNGTYFASQGVVFVTMNYRLGYLGFLALEELNGTANGAFGFLDQQLALKWVKDNVEAFGGNSSRVTLFGESAGACSTTFHITTPSSFPYFQQAIIESSPCFGESVLIDESLKLGKRLSFEKGCVLDTLRCMRRLNATDLIQTTRVPPLPAVTYSVDGVIPKPPLDAILQGSFFTGPLMGGDVLNEGTIFVYGFFPIPMSNFVYESFVPSIMRLYFGISVADVKKALVQYPCAAYNSSDCRVAASALVGDFLIRCPTTEILQKKAALYPDQPVYTYMFAHAPSFSKNPAFGAYHGSELPFVFNTLGSDGTAQEKVLAVQMNAAWVAFAKTGNPSTAAQGVWPQFRPSLPSRVFLNTGDWQTEVDPADNCAFWFSQIYPAYYTRGAGVVPQCASDYTTCNSTNLNCCTFGFECKRHQASACSGGLLEYLCVNTTVPVQFGNVTID